MALKRWAVELGCSIGEVVEVTARAPYGTVTLPSGDVRKVPAAGLEAARAMLQAVSSVPVAVVPPKTVREEAAAEVVRVTNLDGSTKPETLAMARPVVSRPWAGPLSKAAQVGKKP